MRYIPSPRDFRRTLLYTVIVALAALFLIPLPFPSLAFDATYATILAILAVYLFVKYTELKKYGFDDKGLYRRGKLLFDWRQVKRIGLKFGKGGGSVTLVAPPTWGVMLSGGPMQRETLVTYRASLVFGLEDGRFVEVASNLDRMTQAGVIESIDEAAKAANPRIEFD